MENEFQYRLLKSIANARMSASDLSRATGIDKAALSNYINGKYIPKQDKCYLLARALDVDPGWLMTGNEPIRSTIVPTFESEEEELIYHWRKADISIRMAIKKLLDMK